MAASVMTGAISLANSVTAPSNRGSLALPVFFFGKKSVEYSAGDPAGGCAYRRLGPDQRQGGTEAVPGIKRHGQHDRNDHT